MNSNDKRRLSGLIEREYRAKREAISSEISPADVEAEVELLITKNKLRDKVNKLTAARALVESLDKQLSVEVGALRTKPKAKRRGRYDGCECHDDYSEMLQEIAKANLSERNNAEKLRTNLLAEERRLLAKVEVAKSVDDLEKVAKAAGLI